VPDHRNRLIPGKCSCPGAIWGNEDRRASRRTAPSGSRTIESQGRRNSNRGATQAESISEPTTPLTSAQYRVGVATAACGQVRRVLRRDFSVHLPTALERDDPATAEPCASPEGRRRPSRGIPCKGYERYFVDPVSRTARTARHRCPTRCIEPVWPCATMPPASSLSPSKRRPPVVDGFPPVLVCARLDGAEWIRTR
jgi:hypothetical protein